jgi:hypothetical protein
MAASEITKLLARKGELETLLQGFEVWLLFFGIFVVIGVAGESFFGIRTWWNNRTLQQVNHSIDEYRLAEAARFNKEASDARERAMKLQVLIQPRELTVEQQHAIGDALRSYSGRKLIVWSPQWDPEAYPLSKQIVASLRFGNLDVRDSSGIFVSPGLVSLRGVTIRWSLSQRDLAYRLAELLGSVGHIKGVVVEEGHAVVIVPGGKTTPDPTPMLDVFVNSKPFDLIESAETPH